MALYLTEEDVRSLLSMEDALEAVEEGFRQQAAARAANSPRSRIGLADAQLSFMAAAAPGLGFMGTKTYGGAGPTRFYVMLYSTSTGQLLAVIEASGMGQVRTGAASGIATRHMARPEASRVGMIGAGYQAATQLKAVCKVRPVTQAKVFGRSTERRQSFADTVGPKLGVDVVAVDSAEDCVRDSDIVITITSASEPVLKGEWLGPGTHVNAAGANHRSRREIDDEAVRRADIVAADDVEQARIECGDLIHPIERGVARWEQVRDLCDVVSGKAEGRDSDRDITLFESQGLALEDVATGAQVYRLAQEKGIGRKLPD